MKKSIKALSTLALATSAAIFSLNATAKDYDTVRIATEGAFAPWNFIDSAGNLTGFDVDLANNLCERMEIKCTLQSQEWGGIIPSLKARKYDVIMAAMTITEKREKAISFSRDYAATPSVMVVDEKSSLADFKTDISSIHLASIDPEEKAALAEVKKAFAGKVIGVQSSTTHEKFLKEYLSDDVTIRSYGSQETLDLDLESGRIDVALAAMSYWKPLLDSDKGKGMKMVGPGYTGGPFGKGVGVGVRKGDEALADKFTVAINDAIADGTVKKLAVKWFGFDASAK